MNRASPVDLRIALEMAHSLAKAGVDFVTIPVLSNEDKAILVRDAYMRLDQIEKERSNAQSAP
mgnify:FL=1